MVKIDSEAKSRYGLEIFIGFVLVLGIIIYYMAYIVLLSERLEREYPQYIELINTVAFIVPFIATYVLMYVPIALRRLFKRKDGSVGGL